MNLTAGSKTNYLARLEQLAAIEIMGWRVEHARMALFWADDDGIPTVAVSKWHPFTNSEQAALLVKTAEEE